MRSSGPTALGIDVTETQISVALLRKGEEGFHVLHATRAPVPKGAIEYGRIVAPSTLMSVLKALKERHKARTGHVALSLPMRGTLTRVLPLEELDPQQIARFAQGEVKQYASFSGRETVSDFRVLVPATSRTVGKLLITAADYESVGPLVSACRNAGMPSATVESAVTACVRAYAAVKTGGTSDWTLLALLKDGTLTLSVLCKGILDYVRTKPVSTVDTESQSIHERLIDECNAVMQFYGTKDGAASGHWGVVIVDETDDGIPEDARQSIRSRVSAGGVEFWTRAGWPNGLAVDGRAVDGLPITAIGLAMRVLQEDSRGPNVNLLPQEETRVSIARRNMLLAANILAALVIVVVLLGGGVSWMAGRVNKDIADLKQAALERGDRALPVAVSALASVEQRTAALSAELDCLRRMSESRLDVDWVRLLNDIKGAVPSVLRITELSLDDTSAMRIKGVSRSYEGVDTFVEMLNRSGRIHHARLVRESRATPEQADVRYTVKCSLTPGRVR